MPLAQHSNTRHSPLPLWVQDNHILYRTACGVANEAALQPLGLEQRVENSTHKRRTWNSPHIFVLNPCTQIAEYNKTKIAWGQYSICIFPSRFGIKNCCFITQTFSLQLECMGLKKLNHEIYAFSALTIGLQQQIKLYPLLKGVTNLSHGLHIGLSSDLYNETIGYILCPIDKGCF